MVKTDDARWVTFSRFVAERYAAKFGLALPRAGFRVEMADPLNINANTLTVKQLRGERMSLPTWVQQQRKKHNYS